MLTASRGRSLARAAGYLTRRHLLRHRHMVARARIFDLRFRFRSEDAVGRHIYKYGVHEESLTRFLLERVRFEPGDVVFDVGANIGWHSLVLDRLLPADGRVYALEPDPENFALLSENIAVNRAGKVRAHRRALSDAPGEGRLHRYGTKNLGRHSMLPLHDGGDSVEVSVTTLDEFRAGERIADRAPRLLKVDVEGYEYAVLRGAEETLRDCPLVVAEHCPALLDRAGRDPGEALELLADLGFHPHRLEGGRPVPVRLEELAEPRDAALELAWLREPAGPRPRASRPEDEEAPRQGSRGRPSLTVTLITRNEEERLGRTLESVAWADEIVVVDSGSTDGTEEVARRYTKHFHHREWEGYGIQKQRALELAAGDWVLAIDADEVVSPALARSIQEVLRRPGDMAGYRIRLETWMLGRWFGTRGWWREWKLRLVRRDRARWANPLVHEALDVDGPVGRLDGALLHYHDRGLSYEVERVDNYSTLAAEQLERAGKGSGGVVAPLFRTVTYFLQRYLVQGGILYGRAGVVDACMRALYGFLKYAKLWELRRARTRDPRERPGGPQERPGDPRESPRDRRGPTRAPGSGGVTSR